VRREEIGLVRASIKEGIRVATGRGKDELREGGRGWKRGGGAGVSGFEGSVGMGTSGSFLPKTSSFADRKKKEGDPAQKTKKPGQRA